MPTAAKQLSLRGSEDVIVVTIAEPAGGSRGCRSLRVLHIEEGALTLRVVATLARGGKAHTTSKTSAGRGIKGGTRWVEGKVACSRVAGFADTTGCLAAPFVPSIGSIH